MSMKLKGVLLAFKGDTDCFCSARWQIAVIIATAMPHAVAGFIKGYQRYQNNVQFPCFGWQRMDWLPDSIAAPPIFSCFINMIKAHFRLAAYWQTKTQPACIQIAKINLTASCIIQCNRSLQQRLYTLTDASAILYAHFLIQRISTLQRTCSDIIQ